MRLRCCTFRVGRQEVKNADAGGVVTFRAEVRDADPSFKRSPNLKTLLNPEIATALPPLDLDQVGGAGLATNLSMTSIGSPIRKRSNSLDFAAAMNETVKVTR